MERALSMLQSINMQGLIPKQRLYVHLSKSIEVAYSVGKRHGEPFIYVVHTGDMARQDINFIFRRTVCG